MTLPAMQLEKSPGLRRSGLFGGAVAVAHLLEPATDHDDGCSSGDDGLAYCQQGVGSPCR